MMRQVCITSFQGRPLTAVYEEDRLMELWLQEAETDIRIGDIYIGKVKNVVPNLSAAFVEFYAGQMGYYPLDEEVPIRFLNRKNSQKAASGDEILVQVAGEARGLKEWRLTGRLTFSGQYAVYSPDRTDNRVSAKLREREVREHLLAMPGKEGTAGAGWLFRTAAGQAKESVILEEMRNILTSAEDLLAAAKTRTCFSRLLQGQSLEEELIGRRTGTDAVTDRRMVYEELSARFPGQVRFYEDDGWPLIKVKGLEAEIEKALRRKVWLPSGGFLVIDQTEAMTVIDVNSGKSVGKQNKEDHLLKVNREAAREALRQVRLRNLSGIILIDFINMKHADHIRELTELLRETSRQDPIQTTFVDFTGLQIAELTRKKSRKTLAESLK